MLRLLAVPMLVLVCAVAVRAEDAPTTQPTTSTAVIAATDTEAIKSKVGETLTVEGVVDIARWSSSGKVMNIYFKDARNGFMCAVFEKNKEKMDAAFEGDAAAKFQGAKIQVNGKIGTFRDRPQIVIETPEQVTIVEAAK